MDHIIRENTTGSTKVTLGDCDGEVRSGGRTDVEDGRKDVDEREGELSAGRIKEVDEDPAS